MDISALQALDRPSLARRRPAMERLERRRFLKQAALAAGGALPLLAAAGVSKAQQLARATSEVVHGRILAISGLTLAVETRDGIRALTLGGGSRIWKGGGASYEPLQPGDILWAKAFPMRDGTLVITDLWANIVNVSGRIDTIISSTTFVMQWGPFGTGLSSARTTTVTIDNRTIFGSGSTASSGTLEVGKAIQVIGTAVDESSIHATRIFV
jgi:hypothetical protein